MDPSGEYHDPRVQGFDPVDGKYVALPREERPDGTVAVWSPVLQLEQHFKDERLRFWNPKAGKYLERPEEESERLQLGERRPAGKPSWHAGMRSGRAK